MSLPRAARAKSMIVALLLSFQGCATESATSTPPARIPIAKNTPSGAIFSEVPELSEVVNSVTGKLSRYGLRESVKGARIDCMISLDGHATDCMDVTPPEPNGFSKAFSHALEQPGVQFEPMTLNGFAVAGRHVFAIDVRASRVRLDSPLTFSSQPDPGVPVRVESLPNYRAFSPTAKGNTPPGAIYYGLSFVPSNHRFPFYPPELQETGLAGEAHAICTIQVDGHLTNCRELSSTGSPAFGAALMTWLTAPGLLAHPLLLNGFPVVGTREFASRFRTDGTH